MNFADKVSSFIKINSLRYNLKSNVRIIVWFDGELMFSRLIAGSGILRTCVRVLLVGGSGILVYIVGIGGGTDADGRGLGAHSGFAGRWGRGRTSLLLLESHLDQPVGLDLVVQHDIEQEHEYSLELKKVNFGMMILVNNRRKGVTNHTA